MISVRIEHPDGKEEVETYFPNGTEDQNMVLAICVFSLWFQTYY